MSKTPAQNGKTIIEAPKIDDAVATRDAKNAAIAIISIDDPKLRSQVLSVLKKPPSGEDGANRANELSNISSKLKKDNKDITRIQIAELSIRELSSNGLSQQEITRLVTDQIFDIEIKKPTTIGIQTHTKQGEIAETALDVAAKSYDSIIQINNFPSESALLVSESYKNPTTNRHFQKDAQEMLANAKSPEAAEKAFAKLCKEYKFSPDSQDEKSKRSFIELRKLTDSFIELSFGVNAANMRALDSYKPSIADEAAGIDEKKIKTLTKYLTDVMKNLDSKNVGQEYKQQEIAEAFQKKATELGINTDSKASEYLQSSMVNTFVGREKDSQGVTQSPKNVMNNIVTTQGMISSIRQSKDKWPDNSNEVAQQTQQNAKRAIAAESPFLEAEPSQQRGISSPPPPPQQNFGPIPAPGLNQPTPQKPQKPPRRAPKAPQEAARSEPTPSPLSASAAIYPEPPKQPTREGIAAPDIKKDVWRANADAGMIMTTVLETHKDKLGLKDEDVGSFNSVQSTEDVRGYIAKVAETINKNPEIKQELEQALTTEYRNAFNNTQTSEINWSAQSKSNDGVTTLTLPDAQSKLKVTSIKANIAINGKNIASYRSIDFPAKVEPGHPMKISMALQDKDGKNMPADKAIFFEAIYDEKGKLLDVNAPEGVKFTKEGVGYIEKEGEIYTLPVNQDQYYKMKDLAAKNKAEIIGLNEPTQEREQAQAQRINQEPKMKEPEVAADQIAVAQAPKIDPRSEALSSQKVSASPAQPDSPELASVKLGQSSDVLAGLDDLPQVSSSKINEKSKVPTDEQLEARLAALSSPSGKAPSQDFDLQSVAAEAKPVPAAEVQELKPQAAASPAVSATQSQRPEPKDPDLEFLKMTADKQAADLKTTINTSQNLSVAIFKFNSAGDPQNYVGDSLASNPQVDILLSSNLDKDHKVLLFKSTTIENKADIVKELMLQSDASTELYPNAKEAGELAKTLFRSASTEEQAAIFAVTASADTGRAKELMESLSQDKQKELITEIKEAKDGIIEEPTLKHLVRKDRLEQAIKDLDTTAAGQALRKPPPPARSTERTMESPSIEQGSKRPPSPPASPSPRMTPDTIPPPSPLRGEELMERATKGQQELLDADKLRDDEIPSKSNWEKLKDSLQSALDAVKNAVSRKDTKNLDQQEAQIPQSSSNSSNRSDDRPRQQGAAQTMERDQSFTQLPKTISSHTKAQFSHEPSPPRATPPVSRQNSKQQGRGNNNGPTM